MNQKGLSLVEIVVVLVLTGIGTAFALPRLGQAHRNAALTSVTRKLQMNLLRVRSEAMHTGYACGIVFEKRGSSWHCTLVRDGDDDGIRRDDIARGIDLPFSEILELDTGGASLGFLRNVRIPNPSGGGALGGNFEDPVRAGGADILTYRPGGTATPATLYFCDHCESMKAIRIFGLTGRIRVLKWRVGTTRWELDH